MVSMAFGRTATIPFITAGNNIRQSTLTRPFPSRERGSMSAFHTSQRNFVLGENVMDCALCCSCCIASNGICFGFLWEMCGVGMELGFFDFFSFYVYIVRDTGKCLFFLYTQIHIYYFCVEGDCACACACVRVWNAPCRHNIRLLNLNEYRWKTGHKNRSQVSCMSERTYACSVALQLHSLSQDYESLYHGWDSGNRRKWHL